MTFREGTVFVTVADLNMAGANLIMLKGGKMMCFAWMCLHLCLLGELRCP